MEQTKLTAKQQSEFLAVLQERFEQNKKRHQGIVWQQVLDKLVSNPQKIKSLFLMEQTEGEPDVVGQDDTTGEYKFVDCAAESPAKRRSLCYDSAALDARKENKPSGNVMDLAGSMGIELLTEHEYRKLQKLGTFDLKTSSWIKTPQEIRALGGALFCDRRFDTVFMYHNGAQSYYAGRGFRGILMV
jgi:hypothetical protein